MKRFAAALAATLIMMTACGSDGDDDAADSATDGEATGESVSYRNCGPCRNGWGPAVR